MATAGIFSNATEHLLAELEPLRLMLQRQVLRLRAAGLLTEDAFRGLYIADSQVDALLRTNARGSLLPFDWDAEPRDSLLLGELTAHVRAENRARTEASLRAGVDLPLLRLIDRCSLSRAEVDALLVCVAPEFDLGYEAVYAYVQNDVSKKRPTVELVLALLSLTWEQRMVHRQVLFAHRPLFRYHLLQFVDDPHEVEPSSLARFLRAGERVAGHLIGQDAVDRTLLPFTSVHTPERAAAREVLPQAVRDILFRAAHAFPTASALFVLSGSDEAARRVAAGLWCAERGQRLLVCDLAQAVETEQPAIALAAALCREAILQDAGVYLAGIERFTSEDSASYRRAVSIVRALGGLDLAIFLGETFDLEGLPTPVRIDIPIPDAALRRQLWRQGVMDLNSHAPAVDQVADTFSLTSGQIERAALSARQHAAVHGRAELASEDLQRAAREQSHSGLRRLAQKINPIYAWDDIVLPTRALRQLRQVRASIVHRHTVFENWGFASKLAAGGGVNVLFYGPSGAGKTMAAQVLANELGLDLYRIDLSVVVSKYIGETEKNLSTIFREARTSNAILFFDEADALFGKRSEVKDAHDRYANIEVAYLLQQMEEYDGTVILATNLSKNLDEAFARRLHHSVEFPFPDATSRERIWRGVFPAAAPLGPDIDLVFLSQQFELSGGNIRNVALAAAFMAAEEGTTIRMEQLIQSTARELQKMGKLPSRNDFGAYYEATRERSS